jgi:CRISPR/Cas system-associated protein endoribonuclease Cas2
MPFMITDKQYEDIALWLGATNVSEKTKREYIDCGLLMGPYEYSKKFMDFEFTSAGFHLCEFSMFKEWIHSGDGFITMLKRIINIKQAKPNHGDFVTLGSFCGEYEVDITIVSQENRESPKYEVDLSDALISAVLDLIEGKGK